MAEIVGLASAAAGLTSLAIQLGSGVYKLRELHQRSKNLKHDLDVIVDDMEFMLHCLPDPDTCTSQESPKLRAILQHCNNRAQTLTASIYKLAKKFDSIDQPVRASRIKALLKCRETHREIEELKRSILSLKADLTLATTYNAGLLKVEEPILPIQGDSPGTQIASIKSQSNIKGYSCQQRSCPCSCHIRGNVTRRFWSFEYTPLSMVLQNCDNSECSARQYRIAFKWVLTPWGFPLAVKFGLVMTTEIGRCSISPLLETERVVRYTSPGFRLLWEFRTYQINLAQTITGFKELYRKDPYMILHVNPEGIGYIEELIRYPIRGYDLDDGLELLELLIKKFKMKLGLDNISLLYKCASWIGDAPHLDLLESLLHLGLDPSNLPSPHWKEWSQPFSEDWMPYQGIPDPFFLEYMSLLVSKSSDFGGTSPLQSTILTGDNGSISRFLEPSNTTDVNFLGQSPLHMAILREDTALILLEAGYNPNVRDHYGFTPLMYAATMGKLKVAKMLISNDAGLLSVDNIHHRNFIHFAVSRGHYDLVIQLLIHIEAEYKDAEGVNCLLSSLAVTAILLLAPDDCTPTGYFMDLLGFIDDVNCCLERNTTLLHHVNNCEDAEALIAYGFTSWEQEDSNGETPVMSGRMYRNPRWLEICSKNGADLNHRNADGETVLMWIMTGLQGTRELLHDSSASLNFLLGKGAHILFEDHCVCPCAPNGCLPTRVLGIQFAHDGRWHETNPLWTFDVLSELQECGRLGDANELLVSFIRRCAFEEMGLEHVCCMRGHPARLWTVNLEPQPDEKRIPKANKTKVEALERFMMSLSGMTYDQLEKVWFQQLKRTYDSMIRDWEPEQDRDDLSGKELSRYSIDEKNDSFVWSAGSIRRQDPRELPETQLASHFLGLESRYRNSTKTLPDSLQWYKSRATPLFRLASEFGITIEGIVGKILNLRPKLDLEGYELKESEMEECIERIRLWWVEFLGK